MGKISSFLSLSVNISKTVADTAKVTINDWHLNDWSKKNPDHCIGWYHMRDADI